MIKALVFKPNVQGKTMKLKIIIFLFLPLLMTACITAPQPVSDRNSSLTQGNIQMNLEVGKTTKVDVLETFGSPNITTRDGAGREVWTYQRQAQVAESSSKSGYWTVILAGNSSSTAGFESSSRMITLIIKFDDKDVVADFRSRSSNF
ncbi:MAG: outer membrane protein assembly factor BamE (lipoprotein component of BamABCDE complex) [Cellvibrionaceae bacterium]